MARVAQMAEVGSEVLRSDEKAVDAVDCRGLLDLRQCRPRLHLHDQADLAVGVGKVIFYPSEAVGAGIGRNAAHAPRRVTHRRHRALCLFGALYVGNYERLHADVEQTLEHDRIVPVRPHQRGDRIRRDRVQLVVHLWQVRGRVFGVHQHPVEAGAGTDFSRCVAGEAQPATDLRPALAQCALELIDVHIHDFSRDCFRLRRAIVPSPSGRPPFTGCPAHPRMPPSRRQQQ